MPALSASSDTWGISGPQFLVVYAALLALGLLLAILLRRAAGGPDQPGRTPTPAEAALLAEGTDRAVYASVAGLRAAGALGTGTGQQLVATGPLPIGATRLDGAVYEAARRGVALRQVPSDPLVASALAEVQASAKGAGWLLDAGQRGRARMGGLLLLGLTAFGVVRVFAGLANERPVGFLSLLTFATALLAIGFLAAAPRISRAGRSALARLRNGNAHLNPKQSPAWATYGVTGAALGVAIYGTAALWAADPAFAAAAGLRRPAADSSSASSGGDGGGGDGGGGGCGGGCGG